MSPPVLYADRVAAGLALAARLTHGGGREDVIVLGMARGGVPVAAEVAASLGVRLGVIVARKLGVPGLEEAALGAIAEGSNAVITDATADYLGVPATLIDRIVARERVELRRRVARYRAGRPLTEVRGRNVILVDDGIASGATLRAAARSLRAMGARSISAAVPVADPASCDAVSRDVDELIALAAPGDFDLVSSSYAEFASVTDAQVLAALGVSGPGAPCTESENRPEREVAMPLPNGEALIADLGMPDPDGEFRTPRGLVILAHGGGSSRHSYRNRFLGGWLRLIGWSTLRVDLLTAAEQKADAPDASHRFDVPLIGGRLVAAIDWALGHNVPGSARIVLLGASTGAAAAVVAAAHRPGSVAGVVSRGGRVDLAGEALGALGAPLCMIVGTRDPLTLRCNRDVLRQLRGDVELHLVRGASHTFEEARALGAVGRHIERWLDQREPSSRRRWWAPWWRAR